MGRFGYARVSTRGQKDDSQIDALNDAGRERIWVDKASGRLARPFRSVRHMTELAAQLDERGVDLVVLKQGIDTTTPAGRSLFHVVAAMDEMTADLISEGTLEGLESAQARGRVGGRPAASSQLQALEAREMYDELDDRGKRKYTVAQIAETFGVSHKTIYRHLERDNTSLAMPLGESARAE
ncbi:recombinase family protein [Nocardia carnea]|uniref:recombinase family protein n=1 Tax=Nocardia carnea TaxID=37328 RepID=UPI0024583ED4|nr:recombinase family protein [Nocardia carnea]